MAKKFIDPGVFSDPQDGIDLFSNAIRKSFDFDALGGPEFIAKVLTPVQKLSIAQASTLSPIGRGAPGPSSLWSEGWSFLKDFFSADGDEDRRAKRARKMNSQIETKFVYTGRIEEIHGAFLPDPSCDLDMQGHPITDPYILHMHTSFVSTNANSTEFPQVGDLVRVRLSQGDSGYDLETGTHLEIYQSMNDFTGAPHPDCQSLEGLFEGAVIEYVGDGLPGQLGTWDSTDGYVQVTPKSSAVVATTAITNFLEDLRTTIPDSEVETLVVTSGERTAAAQASAIYTKRSLHKCSSAISTTPASSDPCYAIYDLYSNKTLIMEALKVANSTALMQEVFQKQMDRGEFLSRHMSGLGIDIRTSNLTTAQRNYVIKQAKALSANAIYENDPPHIHIGIPDSYGTSTTSLASSTSGDDAGVEDEDVS